MAWLNVPVANGELAALTEKLAVVFVSQVLPLVPFQKPTLLVNGSIWSCRPLSCVEALPVSVMTWVAVSAVNVPIVYWPRPPDAWMLLYAKVTVFPPLLTVSVRVSQQPRESSTQTCTAYWTPLARPLRVKVAAPPPL